MTQATFALRARNPDVLSCIANLSNDEVFTPPELADRMLDSLEGAWAESHGGASIWSDPTVTFLDPFAKSGVFLRQITARLTVGLAGIIPDLPERVDHILTKQVYGIGITELTSLLARRTLYCSKWANGPHSIAKSFTTQSGNIWFERTEHTWVGDECGYKFCKAKKATLDRGDDLETHAYALLHTTDIKKRIAEIFGADMHFDVIVGNPPYQLNDGGGEGASATPLYHRFVEQAKALDPSQIVMVIPARWYSGGKGLDEFRTSMLTDGHLAEIHDFPETDLVFPGVNIRGGVCYFRWAASHSGDARIVNYAKGRDPIVSTRPVLLDGVETFVRHNEAISILEKVRAHGEATMDSRVQSRNPFGIPANFSSYSTSRTSDAPTLLYRSRRGSTSDREVYVADRHIVSNKPFKDKIKVLVSKASPGGDEYPHAVLGRPIVAPVNSVCTETYLIVDMPASEVEAANLVGYMRTRFFRFLVALIKTTQNISKGSFGFVPVQDLTRSWTDSDLHAKYGITPDEIRFIESQVRAAVPADDAEPA